MQQGTRNIGILRREPKERSPSMEGSKTVHSRFTKGRYEDDHPSILRKNARPYAGSGEAVEKPNFQRLMENA